MMVSAKRLTTAKLGEKESLQRQAETIRPSLQLQQEHNEDARKFAEEALKQSYHPSNLYLLEYQSVINLVQYLRLRNANCAKTVVTYLATLDSTLKVANITPDQFIIEAKRLTIDQLEGEFMALNAHWMKEGNRSATRIVKWAMLKVFLRANHVRKAEMLKCHIGTTDKVTDRALTREDCRRILDKANTTEDKLAISLLIETLQRIGTVTKLMWGDLRPHLEKGEDIFLVWIDPARTKCNIEHWMPCGPLVAFYAGKRLGELKQVSDEDKLISCSLGALSQRLHRIMVKLGILGRRQGTGPSTRYEAHIHSWRKFGKHEMQNNNANTQVIEYLMGHKYDGYSEWHDRYNILLEKYREARPRLDEKDSITDIVEYAKSRGYSLDPKDLRLCHGRNGDIGADQVSNQVGDRGAEASKPLTYHQ